MFWDEKVYRDGLALREKPELIDMIVGLHRQMDELTAAHLDAQRQTALENQRLRAQIALLEALHEV